MKDSFINLKPFLKVYFFDKKKVKESKFRLWFDKTFISFQEGIFKKYIKGATEKIITLRKDNFCISFCHSHHEIEHTVRPTICEPLRSRLIAVLPAGKKGKHVVLGHDLFAKHPLPPILTPP